MEEVCPSPVCKKINVFSPWLNKAEVNGYTITDNSLSFTAQRVSLIFRVMGFDCNILEGEMAYYSQMFLINCRYILSVFFWE